MCVSIANMETVNMFVIYAKIRITIPYDRWKEGLRRRDDIDEEH